MVTAIGILAIAFVLSVALIAFLICLKDLVEISEKIPVIAKKLFPYLFEKRPIFYKLDKNRNPVPVHSEKEWAEWFESTHKERHISTYVFGYRNRKDPSNSHQITVSTVFLGVDNCFDEIGEPLLYQTIVEGGVFDGDSCFSSTEEEALRIHNRIIEVQERLFSVSDFLHGIVLNDIRNASIDDSHLN